MRLNRKLLLNIIEKEIGKYIILRSISKHGTRYYSIKNSSKICLRFGDHINEQQKKIKYHLNPSKNSLLFINDIKEIKEKLESTQNV